LGDYLLFLLGGQDLNIVPNFFGTLEPQKTELLFSSTGNELRPKLEIGDSGTIIIWAGPSKTPMFNFYGNTLAVEKINGQVKVSTTIRSSDGHIVAELIRNEWKVSPPPTSWDRNYTNDALEVKDNRGKIILQVKALPDRIQLQGEWWANETNGVRLVKDPQNLGAIIATYGGDKLSWDEVPEIKPMFQYPSETHLGQLAK
jgi:hypothetical protein